MSRRGFTLAELLVVLAVLFILLAMLLPSLARARQRAQQVQCASNLRQWGIALHLYLNANRDVLPEEGSIASTAGIENPEAWFNALPPLTQAPRYCEVYAGNNARAAAGGPAADATAGYRHANIWYCPTRLVRGKNTQSHLNAFHYTFNAVLDGSDSFGGDAGASHTSFMRLSCPGRTVALFESTVMQPEKSPSNNRSGDQLEIYLDARHLAMVNVLLMDGHVESSRVDAVLAVPILQEGRYRSGPPTGFIWGKFE